MKKYVHIYTYLRETDKDTQRILHVAVSSAGGIINFLNDNIFYSFVGETIQKISRGNYTERFWKIYFAICVQETLQSNLQFPLGDYNSVSSSIETCHRIQ